MYVPRLNFKAIHVAISEGSHVAVGISSKCLTIECLTPVNVFS